MLATRLNKIIFKAKVHRENKGYGPFSLKTGFNDIT